VTVVQLASANECTHEIFMEIRWNNRTLYLETYFYFMSKYIIRYFCI
jgi:hypothetical protein